MCYRSWGRKCYSAAPPEPPRCGRVAPERLDMKQPPESRFLTGGRSTVPATSAAGLLSLRARRMVPRVGQLAAPAESPGQAAEQPEAATAATVESQPAVPSIRRPPEGDRMSPGPLTRTQWERRLRCPWPVGHDWQRAPTTAGNPRRGSRLSSGLDSSSAAPSEPPRQAAHEPERPTATGVEPQPVADPA